MLKLSGLEINLPSFKSCYIENCDVANIDFDRLNTEFFFFESSKLKALCMDKLLRVLVFQDRIEISSQEKKKVIHDDPLSIFDQILDFLIEKNAFVVCQFNYDAVNLLEDIYSTDEPCIIVDLYGKNLLFDKTSGLCEFITLERVKETDFLKLEKYSESVSKCKSKVIYATPKDYYIDIVKQAKEDIRNGEIFQIVLSQIVLVESDISTSQLFYQMRKINPSEYSIVINENNRQVICFSPETLLTKKGNIVKTFPIAGTYRIKPQDDVEQKKLEILTDKKEMSEHVMLVDLARNDLGRISKPGSVKVEEYLKIKQLYNLIHVYSVVCGELEEKSITKVILSTFPAGTLTGAPKVRAMQLIEKYEKQRRGLYGGAIGYIFKDEFDLAIAIRMAIKNKENNVFRLQSGAGIVNLSIPENEYQECLTKLRAFFTVMGVNEDDIAH
ncbi:anthranilate synthase component I family protein [Pseudothermotoga thermarum]|uniref:Chorismate binding protein n=1 Tax=Pseudothermotoga thermarum DSM 5069 TaxID=688269 RepID=F7YWY0_9THEM|nr:anthranilate synthase component I family protein [Pseudothermotoga thermarum]AEH50572.1 Chorismate binding protein [Pseudothermotoga thermarum DSM 5069]